MSIKRNKTASRGKAKDSDGESGLGSPKPAPVPIWKDQVGTKSDDAFSPYTLGSVFQKGSLIQHSKFGKGLVTNVDGARIEVLFEEGSKKLGHGTA
jgi:hypothetical protein